MIELKPDRIEPWSYPTPYYAEHAQVWHTRRFATWLLKAGAEPRFGVLLCSGAQAETRWRLLLEEQGVEVLKVRSSIDRPLPQALTQHRGDHFNRRLFLIDGLDDISEGNTEQLRQNFWETLEGQRGQLCQTATWVVLMIQHTQTLLDASYFAPRLIEKIERSCLIWVSQERSMSLKRVLLPPSRHQLLFEAFSILSSPSERVDSLSLGRVFRLGYMQNSKSASEQWKWAYRLWRGEVRDPTAARFGQVGVTEELDEEVTTEDALWALLGRGAAATPARLEQWVRRARTALYGWRVTGDSLSFVAHLSSQAQLSEVQRESITRLWTHFNSDESIPLTNEELRLAEEAAVILNDRLELTRALLTEWLTVAYAQIEDLESCIRVNQALIESKGVWGEAKFCAHERLLELALFTQEHGEARRQVEALELLERDLHSPLFEIRYLEAKSRQLGALDPSRGESVAQVAKELSERFGAVLNPTVT